MVQRIMQIGRFAHSCDKSELASKNTFGCSIFSGKCVEPMALLLPVKDLVLILRGV